MIIIWHSTVRRISFSVWKHVESSIPLGWCGESVALVKYLCVYILLCVVFCRRTQEAQLVRHTKRSSTNHMETSLCEVYFFPLVSLLENLYLKCFSVCVTSIRLDNTYMTSTSWPYREPYLLFFCLLSHMTALFLWNCRILKKSFSSLSFPHFLCYFSSSWSLTGLPASKQGAQRAGTKKEAWGIFWLHRTVLPLQDRWAL